MISSGELKEALNQLADDSEDIAVKVNRFSEDFDDQAKSIHAALNGTSTDFDERIAQSFYQAKDSLDKTVQLLKQSVEIAREYAERL